MSTQINLKLVKIHNTSDDSISFSAALLRSQGGRTLTTHTSQLGSCMALEPKYTYEMRSVSYLQHWKIMCSIFIVDQVQ